MNSKSIQILILKPINESSLNFFWLHIQLKNNAGTPVFFWIVATSLGQIPIEIRALTASVSDAVRATLLVKVGATNIVLLFFQNLYRMFSARRTTSIVHCIRIYSTGDWDWDFQLFLRSSTAWSGRTRSWICGYCSYCHWCVRFLSLENQCFTSKIFQGLTWMNVNSWFWTSNEQTHFE